MSKRVVITGASSGLGLALADKLSELGAQVHGCGRRPLQTTKFGYSQVDVSDRAAVAEWSDSLETPDLLINNAALINRNALLWEVPAEEFEALLKVNLGGIHHTLSCFLPRMLENSSGVVANFSSYWGRGSAPEVAPYCMTKWGVEGLTQALSQELPSGFAAVAVNPGIIDTPMLRSCFGAGAGSYPKPEQWADQAAPFFLSLDASNNGDSLTVPQ